MPDPLTASDLSSDLERVLHESATYWSSFATPDFFAPIGSAWSPADNVRHLTKSMRAVTRGLTMPRFLLRLLFGRAGTRSRSYDALVKDYRVVLENGGTAGSFAPNAQDSASFTEAERSRIMQVHATAIDTMRLAIARWDENALDRVRLPHPLLGKLTVREMLYFAVYHNQHHVEVVKRRLSEHR